ncbi:MAG: magnesium transporter [Armatimonadota bacterium]
MSTLLSAESLRLLAREDPGRLKAELEFAHPADIAEALADLDDAEAVKILAGVPDLAPAVIEHLPAERQETLLRQLAPQQASDVLEEMASDEAADLLAELPAAQAEQLLKGMAAAEAADVRELLAYPPHTAGGLMATEVVTVRAEGTVGDAVARLREIAPDAETIYYVYVVDAAGRLVGVVSLRDLILARPLAPLASIIRANVVAARVGDDQEAVARLFEKYRLKALPVVDPGNRLLGVVTVDDIIHVVTEEASEDAYKLAGLVEEVEAFDSPVTRAAKRLPWLLALLVAEGVAARVIGGFEHTLAAVIALAYYIPVVTDMAGNMGIQSVAVAVRSIATGEVDRRSYRQLILRECLVGVSAGAASGLVGLGIAVALQGDILLGATVGVTLMAVTMVAALLGSTAPLVLTTMRKDPAVASGPFVTSSMDVVTILIYFTVAVLIFRGRLGV